MAIKKKSIIQGALILSLASVITRLLGFVWRVYMAGTIGAEGMGLYQLIMPLYGLAWSIACSGINTGISKLTAQESAKGEYGNMGLLLKTALFISVGIATAISFIVYFGAKTISVNIYHDARVIMSIQILSLAFPFMAAGSVIRGYFLGLRQNTVPAISQVIEQCVRMGIIYAIAGFMMPLGLQYACAAAVIGVVAEEAVSFLYLLYSYRSFKIEQNLTKRPSWHKRETLMCLFAVAAPITASRVTGSFLSAAENTLIPASLQKFGMTAQEAVSAFGRITGMATPLIFFPSALLTALSITLLPAISEAAAIGNKERVGAVTNKALKFTTLIGIGAAGIFLVLPDELGQVIYKEDIGSILFLLGIMCPLWYINITVSGILNGLGKQTFLFMTGLAGSLVNIACVYFVVPKFGVNAFIAGWAISLVLGCALSFWQIGKSAEIKFQITDWFIKPAIAAAGTSMSVEILSKKVLFPFFGDVLGLIMSLALIAALYVVFICLLGCADVSNFKNLLSSIKLKKKATL